MTVPALCLLAAAAALAEPRYPQPPGKRAVNSSDALAESRPAGEDEVAASTPTAEAEPAGPAPEPEVSERPEEAQAGPDAAAPALTPASPAPAAGGAGLGSPSAGARPSSSGGGASVPMRSSAAGGGEEDAKSLPAVTCVPPNRKRTIEAVLARPGMKEALHRACRNNTDWTFPDAVVDELRKTDKRWGYLCRRGHCNDPSHDVLAYYCGEGRAFEGSDFIRGVDYITASCYNDPSDGNPGIGWGLLDPQPPGVKGWTGRGRLR